MILQLFNYSSIFHGFNWFSAIETLFFVVVQGRDKAVPLGTFFP